jgi:hypothetical protein
MAGFLLEGSCCFSLFSPARSVTFAGKDPTSLWLLPWGCFWVVPEPHGFRQFVAGFRPAEDAICDYGGALA